MKSKKAIKKLKNKVDGFEDYAIELEILTKAVQLQNDKLQSEIKTVAKHVQNAEEKVYYLGEVTTGFVEELRGKVKKLENCSCKEKSSIIDPDRPKEIVSPLIDFRNEVAFHYANAVGKSIVDYIKTNPNQFKSGLAERKRETIQFNGEPLEVTEMQKLVLRDHFTLQDTNTQKTDKNATERQGEGEKECFDTDAEMRVIGAMLLDRDSIPFAMTFLSDEHFYGNNNRLIYSTIIQMYQNGEKVDIVSLAEALRNESVLDDDNSRYYLADILGKVPSAKNIKEDAITVRSWYNSRVHCKSKPETIVTNEMFNEELERFLSNYPIYYTALKFTSTENSYNYIGALINDAIRVASITSIQDIIRSKLKSKGEHYNKESDRYANFKDALARNKEEQPHLFANWTVVDKINSYKDKHIQWLIDTKGTEQSKNDLQEAYIDVICYCIMCYIYLKFNGEAVNG